MLVKLFGSLRSPGAPDRYDVQVGPEVRVQGVLESLFTLVPGLRQQVLQPDRAELLPHVNVMVNGRLIRDLQGLETRVTSDSTLAIFPPSAGG